MSLGYSSARLIAFAIAPGEMLLLLFLIAFGGNPATYVEIGLLYTIVVVVAIGAIFGFDATRQDIIEDLLGVDEGSLDPISAHELVERSDRSDRNFVSDD